MITSSSNAQVKQMIQLNKKARERRKQDVFLVEGLRMFREVPRDRLVKTYVSENFLEDPDPEDPQGQETTDVPSHPSVPP